MDRPAVAAVVSSCAWPQAEGCVRVGGVVNDACGRLAGPTAPVDSRCRPDGGNITAMNSLQYRKGESRACLPSVRRGASGWLAIVSAAPWTAALRLGDNVTAGCCPHQCRR